MVFEDEKNVSSQKLSLKMLLFGACLALGHHLGHAWDNIWGILSLMDNNPRCYINLWSFFWISSISPTTSLGFQSYRSSCVCFCAFNVFHCVPLSLPLCIHCVSLCFTVFHCAFTVFLCVSLCIHGVHCALSVFHCVCFCAFTVSHTTSVFVAGCISPVCIHCLLTAK